jgi:hypothetical protein
MSQCWPLQMPPSPKAVLISLADNANDDGHCYPSIPRICKRTCLGRTAVIDAIKWLEQHGAVVADRSNGRHTTYTVTPKAYRNQSATRTGTPSEPVRQTDATSPPAGRDQSARRTLTVKEPSDNRQVKNTPARPQGVEPEQWADWLALRKEKRAPVTATALEGVAREAAKAGMTLQAALSECCARGWAGFKAEWVSQPSRASPAERRDAETAEFLGRLTGGLAGTKPNREVVDVEPANVRRIA